jgi:hypothetical protein
MSILVTLLFLISLYLIIGHLVAKFVMGGVEEECSDAEWDDLGADDEVVFEIGHITFMLFWPPILLLLLLFKERSPK